MKSLVLGPVVLASARLVLGSPMPGVEAKSIETVLYKRGDVLDKRGYELAAMHGVDVNEMYRHSLVRRSDGDDVTIWVHNSYNETIIDEEDEDDATTLRGRALTLPGKPPEVEWRPDPYGRLRDSCGHSVTHSLTNPTVGAFTGGIHEIVNWSRDNWGSFWVHAHTRDDNKHTGLIIAGSNSGANACFMVMKYYHIVFLGTIIGTDDIRDLSRDTLQFQRQYGSGGLGWRAAATGDMRCSTYNSQEVRVDWRLTSINRNI